MTTTELSDSPTLTAPTQWVAVCAYDSLLPERAVAALIDGHQIAIIRTHDGQVFAVGQRDPFSGANVISRGIVGTRGGVNTITSPVYKQAFDLHTGQCLDDPSIHLPTWPTRNHNGAVQIGM
ncbi:MAG: nitrite reductase small subunit NirD [Angustibacter sp.]